MNPLDAEGNWIKESPTADTQSAPPQSPAQQAPTTQQSQQQGLPPTGLQQQMNALHESYAQFQGVADVGFDPRQWMFEQQQQSGNNMLEGQSGGAGSTSLDAMAKSMAQRYGLNIGRGRLVDESGNFLYTPDQLAQASGGAMTTGEASAKMMYISQAVTKKQNEQQQQKGIAALETGLGQVQSRGRGSLAAMQSGYYQDLGDMYANQEYQSADFSFYIQQEQNAIANELMRRSEELATNQARSGFVVGVGLAIVGALTGNVALVVGGAAQAGASGAQTGWF